MQMGNVLVLAAVEDELVVHNPLLLGEAARHKKKLPHDLYVRLLKCGNRGYRLLRNDEIVNGSLGVFVVDDDARIVLIKEHSRLFPVYDLLE